MRAALHNKKVTQRDINRARVFETIHLLEPVSRSEIATKIGLTSAAVTYLVSELLELGFIVELGRRSSSRGQPAIDLGVNAEAACTVGLHFDHRSISGAISDLKGNLHSHIEIKLTEVVTPDVVLSKLIETGNALLSTIPADKLLGVGLATVGPIDVKSGTVCETPFMMDWGRVPLRRPLAEALQANVYMDNNATAAAIGEYWYGVGRDYKNFLSINFGSKGLGGGLFIDHRVYRGRAINAAEFGHMLVQDSNSASSQPTFLENRVSGFAFEQAFNDSVLNVLANQGDSLSDELESWFDQSSALFAQAVVSANHLLDLDAILLDGQLPPMFIQQILRRVNSKIESLYMPGWKKQVSLQIGQAGCNSVLLGAAALPIYDAFTSSVQSVPSLRPVSLFNA